MSMCYEDVEQQVAELATEQKQDVPEQMSLIGFNNGLIARYLRPKLTAINYPIKMMAEQTTLLSLRLANADNNLTDSYAGQIFALALVIRHSVSKKKTTIVAKSSW